MHRNRKYQDHTLTSACSESRRRLENVRRYSLDVMKLLFIKIFFVEDSAKPPFCVRHCEGRLNLKTRQVELFRTEVFSLEELCEIQFVMSLW